MNSNFKNTQSNSADPTISTQHSLKKAYFAFTWTRCFRRLGRLLAGLVLLGMICAAAICGLTFVNKNDDTPAASRFNVVFVMPKGAGLHYTLALGMVSNMESLSSMVTIKQTTSEDEAREMLESGEVKAAVIIPEGMIYTIMSGSNDLPARILYPGEPGLETIIFRQIVDSLSQMVASSQTGVYALYEIYDDFGASEKQQDKANSQLNDLYISTVLARDNLFSVQVVTTANSVSNDTADTTASTDTDNSSDTLSNTNTSDLVLVGYLCSGLALLFLLFGINLCFFFVAPNRSVPAALTRLGLSDAFCTLADFSAAFVCEWLIFFVGCVAVDGICYAIGLISFFSVGRALFSCMVCAVFSCALSLLICRICRNKQACMIVTFVVSLLIMYVSGCLIPSAFLPDVLRGISAFLPGSQINSCIFWQFGQTLSISDLVWLLAEAFLLIIIALGIGTRKKANSGKQENRTLTERRH